jgi:hypothetical protein
MLAAVLIADAGCVVGLPFVIGTAAVLITHTGPPEERVAERGR